MKVNLWEAYDLKKISVDISENFKDKIRNYVEGNIKKISSDLKINPARVYEYFIYQNNPIPLEVLMNLCKLMNISKEEMQKNIRRYKQKLVPIKNSINQPKLPIDINPYFTSIISNL
jgi:hypothetical protein